MAVVVVAAMVLSLVAVDVVRATPALAATGNAPQQGSGSAANLPHTVPASQTSATSGAAPNRPQIPGALPEDVRHQPAAPQAHVPPHDTVTVGQPPTSAAKGFDPQASVEVQEHRDSHTQVFANPDGSRTARVFQDPTFFQAADGSWAPIDSTLTPETGGWRDKSSTEAKHFATAADAADVARLQLDSSTAFGFSVAQAAHAAGQVTGASVTYSQVRAGADLTLQATGSGVKETITLRSKDAPSAWDFPLDLQGLTAKSDSGGIALSDVKGVVRARIPHGFMEDSAVDPHSGMGARSDGVTYALDTSGAVPVLKVSVDPTWLNDPARVFPVRVDPTVQSNDADGSTYVASPYNNDYSSDSISPIGTYDAGQNQDATYLAFGSVSNNFAGDYIMGVKLWMYEVYSYSCQARPVSVYPVTQPWSVTGLKTWPGPAYGAEVANASFAAGYDSTCGSAWEGIDLGNNGVNLVSGWAHGSANNGLTVRATDQNDSYAWKKFASSNSANHPHLDITYSPYWATYQPGSSMNPAVGPNQDGVLPVTVTNQGRDTWTPTNNYQLGYHIWDSTGAQLPDSTMTAHTVMPYNVAPGQTATINATIHRLNPGTYTIKFDMDQYGTSWFSTQGVPMSGPVTVTVVNAAPVIDSAYPPSDYDENTLTPELFLTAHDPDGWPGNGLQYEFKICDISQTCTDSGMQANPTWTVPAGKLSWGTTYTWWAKVSDTVDSSPWSAGAALNTVVPQPGITSHLAAASTEPDKGFDPGVGNYTTAVTDAVVKTVGPDLAVVRTYNSLDPRTTEAFGAGWSSRFDTVIVPDQDGSGNVVVTYPDGQQVRFGLNPNGSYAAPRGRFATLSSITGGGWTLMDKSATTYTFDASGKLTKITDHYGRAETLTYDTNNKLQTVTAAGGRALHFTWAASHVASVSTDAVGTNPLTWNYTYTGDQLTKACDPTNACTTYTYETGSHYRSAVLDSNPQAYWRMSEASGTTAGNEVPPLIGTATGTYSNVTLGQPGPLAASGTTAAGFNGSTSYMQIPDHLVQASSYLSVELWFHTTSTAGGVLFSTANNLITDPNPTLGAMPVLYVGTDGKLYGHFWNGQTNGITSAAAVTDGAWHHVLLSGAGNTQTLYLDGATVGTATGQLYNVDPHDYVGAGLLVNQPWPARPADNWGHFNGAISDLAFYTHPLGQPAMQEHYGVRGASNELTATTQPSGNSAVALTYDAIHDRVAQYTDHNGGAWKLGTPAVEGDGVRYSDAVDAAMPDGDWKLAESTGTTAAGQTSRTYGRYSGTHTGKTTSSGGPLGGQGGVHQFDGTTDLVQMPDNEVIGSDQIAVELWFNTTSSAGGVLFSTGNNRPSDANPTGGAMPVLYVGTDGKLYGHLWNTLVGGIVSPNPVTDGTWHHVVLSAANNNQTLYLDGAAIGSQAGQFYNSDPYDYIGTGLLVNQAWPARPADNWGHFNGLIGEAALYQHALDANAVQAHYAARTGLSAYLDAVYANAPHTIWQLGDTGPFAINEAQVAQGTYSGVTLAQPGPMRKSTAGSFDGSTSYLQLPDSEIEGRTQESVETWFKTGSTAGGVLFSTANNLITDSNPSLGAMPVLYVGTDGKLYGHFWNGQVAGIATATPVNDNTWHHVVLAASGNSQTLYLDGVSVGSQNGTVASVDPHTYVGAGLLVNQPWPARPADNWGHFSGLIGDTTIYHQPLDWATVNDHHAALSSGSVVHVTDPNGHDVVYSFDLSRGGRLTNRTDATGAVRAFHYDTGGFVQYELDENGHEFSTAHDARGNVIAKTALATTYYGYYLNTTNPLDPRNDQLTAVRDARSSSSSDNTYLTSYTYTAQGDLATTTTPSTPDFANGRTTSNAYTAGTETAVGGGTEPAGLLATTTDPRGGVTRYAYTAAGDLAQTTDPAGKVTTNTYDAIGRLTAQTVTSSAIPAGATTSYTYDGASRVTQTLAPQAVDVVSGLSHQQRTVNAYNTDGKLTSSTVDDAASASDPARTTGYGYDTHDRRITTTDPMGGVTTDAFDVNGDRTQHIDAAHHELDYAYTARNELATTTVKGFDGDGTAAHDVVLESRAYDPAGRLASVTDAMGRTTSSTYYDDGRLAATTLTGFHNPDGTTSNIPIESDTYDAAGHRTVVDTNGGASRTRSTWDAAGRLTDSTLGSSNPEYSIGQKTSYAYDASDNPTTITKTDAALGTTVGVTDYTYDLTGHQLSQAVHNSNGNLTTTIKRDEQGLPTAITDPRGNVTGADPTAYTTTFTYDPLGRVTATTAAPVTVEVNGSNKGSQKPVSQTGFDTFGDTVEHRDANSNTVTTTYDKLGRPTAQTKPSYTPPGGVAITPTTHTGYDPLGNTTSTTDAVGNTTSYAYDALGDQVSKTDPVLPGQTQAGVWHYTYDPDREALSTTDPTGAQTQATFDDLGRQITSTAVERNPAPTRNLTTKSVFTAGGDLASTTTPDGATTQFTYDFAHNRTKIAYPAGNATTVSYDAANRPTQTTDGLGNTTANAYDLAGRLTSVTDKDPTGATLRTRSYGYDPAGNQTSATGGAGETITGTYDAANHLVSMVEPISTTASITTSSGYDAAGNRTRYTDGNNNATISTVNSWNLPESTIEPATTATPNAPDRTYSTSYDADGRASVITEPGGVTRTRTYDPLGDLTKETGAGAEAATPDRVLGYDLIGRLTSASAPTGTDTYTYDDRGDLLSTAGPSGAATFAFNGESQMTSRSDVAGNATFGYDTNNRLASATDPITGATRTYGYDNADQLTTVGFGTNAAKRTYTYDALHRLTGDTLAGPAGATTASIAYGYDLDDRLTSKNTVGVAGASNNTYIYDQAGRLTSWNNGTTTTGYGWDNAGNRIQTGTVTATYDQRNRLLTQGGTSYTYTLRGTQASRTSGSTATSVKFDAFDRLATDGTSTYTYDALDRVAANGTQALTYTGLGNDLAADGAGTYSRDPNGGLLALGQGTTKSETYSDQHNDLVATFNPTNATIADSSSYDPFGQTTATSGNHNLGYQGAYTDPTTGHVNMAARWYQPETGAFQSRDSFTANPQPSMAANRYTYAKAAPPNSTDPTGHYSCAPASPIALCEPDVPQEEPGVAIWDLVAGVVDLGVMAWDWFSQDPSPAQPAVPDPVYGGGWSEPGQFPAMKPDNETDPAPWTSPADPSEDYEAPEQTRPRLTQLRQTPATRYRHQVPTRPVIDRDTILRQIANTPHPRPPLETTIAPEIQQLIDDVQAAIQITLDIPSNKQAYQPAQAGQPTLAGEPGVGGLPQIDGSNFGLDDPNSNPTRHNIVVDGTLYKWDADGNTWHPVAWGAGDGAGEDSSSINQQDQNVSPTYDELRKSGLKDAHHIIQDAAVRDVPGYRRSDAPAVQLDGPSTLRDSPHYRATQVQRSIGLGGTYGAEVQIAACALSAAGCSQSEVQNAVDRANAYFMGVLGLTFDSKLRIPGNRRMP